MENQYKSDKLILVKSELVFQNKKNGEQHWLLITKNRISKWTEGKQVVKLGLH